MMKKTYLTEIKVLLEMHIMTLTFRIGNLKKVNLKKIKDLYSNKKNLELKF